MHVMMSYLKLNISLYKVAIHSNQAGPGRRDNFASCFGPKIKTRLTDLTLIFLDKFVVLDNYTVNVYIKIKFNNPLKVLIIFIIFHYKF